MKKTVTLSSLLSLSLCSPLRRHTEGLFEGPVYLYLEVVTRRYLFLRLLNVAQSGIAT